MGVSTQSTWADPRIFKETTRLWQQDPNLRRRAVLPQRSSKQAKFCSKLRFIKREKDNDDPWNKISQDWSLRRCEKAGEDRGDWFGGSRPGDLSFLQAESVELQGYVQSHDEPWLHLSGQKAASVCEDV